MIGSSSELPSFTPVERLVDYTMANATAAKTLQNKTLDLGLVDLQRDSKRLTAFVKDLKKMIAEDLDGNTKIVFAFYSWEAPNGWVDRWLQEGIRSLLNDKHRLFVEFCPRVGTQRSYQIFRIYPITLGSHKVKELADFSAI